MKSIFRGFLSLFLIAVAPIAHAVEEVPSYVIDHLEHVEIKRVDPHWIVEMELEGNIEEVGNRAFRTLVNYIGGANRRSQSIAMTAPVNQTNAESEKISMTAPVNQTSSGPGRWKVSFVLPVEYTKSTPPEPTDGRLSLRKIPERTVAVLRYRGTWSQSNFEDHRLEFERVLKGQSKWAPQGSVIWARFDPPFMPWFLRRNEIQQEVRMLSQQ